MIFEVNYPKMLFRATKHSFNHVSLQIFKAGIPLKTVLLKQISTINVVYLLLWEKRLAMAFQVKNRTFRTYWNQAESHNVTFCWHIRMYPVSLQSQCMLRWPPALWPLLGIKWVEMKKDDVWMIQITSKLQHNLPQLVWHIYCRGLAATEGYILQKVSTQVKPLWVRARPQVSQPWLPTLGETE